MPCPETCSLNVKLISSCKEDFKVVTVIVTQRDLVLKTCTHFDMLILIGFKCINLIIQALNELLNQFRRYFSENHAAYFVRVI